MKRFAILLTIGTFLFGLLLPGCEIPLEKESSPAPTAADSEKETNPRPSDLHEAFEIGKYVIETGKEIAQERHRLNQVRSENMERMMAYQLGVPLTSKDLAIEAYRRMSDTVSICLFKRNRHEYLLLKFEGKEEEQLYRELSAYQAAHASEISGTVQLIDLNGECGLREKLVLTKEIKDRTTGKIIDCLTCHD